MLVQKRDELPQLAAEGILEASVNRLVRCFQIDGLRTYKSTRAREEYVAQTRGPCVSEASAVASGREILAAQSDRDQRIIRFFSEGFSAAQIGRSEDLTPQSVNVVKRKFIDEVLA